MDISICSYSFHRLLKDGKQDIFRYITDCKDLGCTLLDPWNGHFPLINEGDRSVTTSSSGSLSSEEQDYVASIKSACDEAGVPVGSVAVDGAHIYEADADARKINRLRAYRWLEIAEILGAGQVRIDAGGPEDMPDDVFAVIKEGYADLIGRAKASGREITVENHWGPTKFPDNVVKLMENVPGLGLLLDTHNWQPELRDEGRSRTAKYATATHIKTFAWDEQGNEVGADIPTAVKYLLDAGYKGCWGIESCPHDGDEYGGATKTVALVKKLVAA